MLYKYRNLINFEWIEDIILYRRLRASEYTELMKYDDMEGQYEHLIKLHPAIRAKLKEDKARLRICSLSKTCKEYLIWSRYANEESGIVIGINENCLRRLYDVRKIQYEGIPEVVDDSMTAEEILSCKTEDLRYEQEVRVFAYEDFIKVEIEKIILGRKITPENELRMRNLIDEANNTNHYYKIKIEKL